MQAVQQFLETTDASNTTKTYGRALEAFEGWLGDEALETLRVADIAAYVAYLKAEGYAPASVNLQLSALRSFLRWCALTERVPAGVYHAAMAVKGVKQPKILPKTLKPSQVEALIALPNVLTVAGARDYAFLRLALASGARLSELTSLRIEDVDFDQQQVVVWGKGSNERVAFFDEEAASAIVYYLGLRGSPATGPLFANDQGERISNRRMQAVLEGYGKRLGVALHPHLLRHSFATSMLDETGDLHAVQQFLGHADIRTTQRYVAGATKRLRRVYDAGIGGMNDATSRNVLQASRAELQGRP